MGKQYEQQSHLNSFGYSPQKHPDMSNQRRSLDTTITILTDHCKALAPAGASCSPFPWLRQIRWRIGCYVAIPSPATRPAVPSMPSVPPYLLSLSANILLTPLPRLSILASFHRALSCTDTLTKTKQAACLHKQPLCYNKWFFLPSSTIYSTDVCAQSAIISTENPFCSMAKIIFLVPSAIPSCRCRFNSMANVIYSRLVSSCCFTRRTSSSTSCTNTPSAALPSTYRKKARIQLAVAVPPNKNTIEKLPLKNVLLHATVFPIIKYVFSLTDILHDWHCTIVHENRLHLPAQ